MLCFRKLLAAKKIVDKRGDERQDFPSKFLFSQSAEKVVGVHFCAVVQKKSGSKKLCG